MRRGLRTSSPKPWSRPSKARAPSPVSRSQEWVTAFEDKIIDQFRRAKRAVSTEAQMEATQVETFDELFAADGHGFGPA